jgi:hypothetical protein
MIAGSIHSFEDKFVTKSLLDLVHGQFLRCFLEDVVFNPFESGLLTSYDALKLVDFGLVVQDIFNALGVSLM